MTHCCCTPLIIIGPGVAVAGGPAKTTLEPLSGHQTATLQEQLRRLEQTFAQERELRLLTEQWLEQARNDKSQGELQHQQIVAHLEGEMEQIQRTMRDMQTVHTSEMDTLKMENARLEAEVRALLQPKNRVPEVEYMLSGSRVLISEDGAGCELEARCKLERHRARNQEQCD